MNAILFDLDDTLLADTVNATDCWRLACQRFAPRAGGRSAEALLGAIEATRQWYWSDPRRHRAGRLDLNRSREEVVRLALDSLGLDDSALAADIARANADLRDERMHLFPGALATLKALRGRGLPMALLTNGHASLQRRKIDRFGLEPYFDCIVIESEFGAGKPDPRVFRHALDRLGAAPAGTCMVGDNLEWDVAGPQRLGVQGVWVDPTGAGLPPGSRVQPDRVIHAVSELIAPLRLRRAGPGDVDFLAAADLRVDLDDAAGEPAYMDAWSEADRREHRAKIAAYAADPDKGAWVYEDIEAGRPVGMVMANFRDRRREPHDEASDFLFRYIDERILPPDGLFCEVFQLWVDPAWRRLGLATALKRQLEGEARRRGMGMIYTHTRARNAGVLALNAQLGYQEVRCGPMWDEAVRVSLVKRLVLV
jgi:putative hydrolase of the HAD superfamily